jgi:hypothetical protein
MEHREPVHQLQVVSQLLAESEARIDQDPFACDASLFGRGNALLKL